MTTITLFSIAMELCAVPGGQNNPKSKKAQIALNEHVKRKQNE